MNGLKHILFIGLSLFVAATFAQSSGSITFDTLTYDFGDVDQSDSLVYEFKFINESNEIIYVDDVITQCGCTSGQGNVGQKVLPNETGQIVISFDPFEKEGLQRKTIRVQFSDFSTVKLVIYANVIN